MLFKDLRHLRDKESVASQLCAGDLLSFEVKAKLIRKDRCEMDDGPISKTNSAKANETKRYVFNLPLICSNTVRPAPHNIYIPWSSTPLIRFASASPVGP